MNEAIMNALSGLVYEYIKKHGLNQMTQVLVREKEADNSIALFREWARANGVDPDDPAIFGEWQDFCCPNCGSDLDSETNGWYDDWLIRNDRTDSDELKEWWHRHHCPSCGYRVFLSLE